MIARQTKKKARQGRYASRVTGLALGLGGVQATYAADMHLQPGDSIQAALESVNPGHTIYPSLA